MDLKLLILAELRIKVEHLYTPIWRKSSLIFQSVNLIETFPFISV